MIFNSDQSCDTAEHADFSKSLHGLDFEWFYEYPLSSGECDSITGILFAYRVPVMFFKFKYKTVSLLGLAISFLLPFNGAAETLSDSVFYALENHPSIKGAQSGYKAAEQGQHAELSGYFPEVTINTSLGRVYQDNATSRGLSVTRGAAYSGYGEGNIALRQTIFDGHETSSRVDAAGARAKSLSFNVKDMEQVVALRAAQNYIEVLRIRAAMGLLNEQAEVIDDYKERISSMVDEGVADEAELQQAKDVAMIIESFYADYEGQLSIAKADYFEAVGREFSAESVEPVSIGEHIYKDIDLSIKLAKSEHPALKSAKLGAEAAEYEIGAEKAQFYPDFTGELSYLKSDKDDVIGGENVDARALVRMNWDFSVGGKQIAQLRQREYSHKEARSNYNSLEREVERDIYQAYAHYETLLRKQDLIKQREDLNAKLVESYKIQFEGARISLLNLMRAESQLFKAHLERSDNYYNLLSAEYLILASMGVLKNVMMNIKSETVSHTSPEEEQD